MYKKKHRTNIEQQNLESDHGRDDRLIQTRFT